MWNCFLWSIAGVENIPSFAWAVRTTQWNLLIQEGTYRYCANLTSHVDPCGMHGFSVQVASPVRLPLFKWDRLGKALLSGNDIEDAMRRHTAAPSFWGLAIRVPFLQVVPAGLCLLVPLVVLV